MGRNEGNPRDRNRQRSPKRHRSPGRKFNKFGKKKNRWPNRKLTPGFEGRQATPPAPSPGMFQVLRRQGQYYEIPKDVVKFTKSEPRLAYSLNQHVPKQTAHGPSDLPKEKEERKVHEKNKSKQKTPVPRKSPTPASVVPEAVKATPERKEKQSVPAIKDTPSIVIKLQPPKEDPPKEKFKTEGNKATVFDIFGSEEPVKPAKKPLSKPSIPILSLPMQLYDDEDEDDLMPTNALCIGSNHIKLAKKKEAKVAPVKEEAPPIETQPEPVEIPKSPREEEILEAPSPPPEIFEQITLSLPDPKRVPSSPKHEELKPLDILKTLDSQSTEVDDFLLQIQEQRQRMEEKLSNTISPKKPAMKFLIDIDSVQKEINEKLEQMPDDFPEELLPPPLSKESLEEKTSVTESSSSEGSSSSSSSDSDSESESSDSSSQSSSSSDSSDSDSESQSEESDKEKGEEIPKIGLNLGIDLSFATRSPVMLKIQQKPRVVASIPALAEEAEEPVAEIPEQPKEPREGRKKSPKIRDQERSERRHRDSRRESREKRDYDRSSSRRSRRRDSEHRQSRLDNSRKKDRRRSRSKSIGKRMSWKRSRSASRSLSPRARLLDRHDSRSRSRSLSMEREGHGRKRSPWRPPIDFWENLNVPTNSWAYNDDQYFNRAYYDESYNYFDQNHQGNNHWDSNVHSDWNNMPPNQNMPNGGGGGSNSPMRGSLDDRINNVLNGDSGVSHPPPPHHQHQVPRHPEQGGEGYDNCYGGNPGYDHYNRPEPDFYPKYDNNPSDHYRQSANLLSINCNQMIPNNSNGYEESPNTPFALQKGNVIELVPSVIDPSQSSSGYQSEDTNNGRKNMKSAQSAQRKAIREKKRMEKKMRKKKFELELQSLLDGEPTIDIIIEGDKPPSPARVEVRKVIFSDGVLPGDGTSDSAMDSSDDSNVDLTEFTSNQLKKYRKKKRKKKTTEKANLPAVPEPAPENNLNPRDAPPPVEEVCPEIESELEVFVPPPPPNDPPSHMVQPTLKREVLERPKKLLYFNTCHRERRMDFFSIFVPFSMFIRLNDPRLLQGHPAIVNRRRIPQPIYPPNVYPPPPQPFQHLPPIRISTMANPMMGPPMGMCDPIPPPQPAGRQIPTIGEN